MATTAGLVQRPRLFAMLDRGAEARVTVVSAPAGSGKSTLLSSWLREARPPGAPAWVAVERDESDATRFWGTVMDALRDSGASAPGDPLATLVPAPSGGRREFIQHLAEGLERVPGPVLLVIDDLHQLRSQEALQGLEELVTRAAEQLHTFVLTRRDPKLGLHRLRLTGELVEIRAADLDFTAGEAGELIAAADVPLASGDVARLHERTEGWAAGLRLAALSLARHEAPDRFVAEFSGSERTVADYLLGEVLASQPLEVRQMLLRTSILERVSGPLADALTGRNDGTGLLHELEEAGAFVVAVDVARSWFRYHHLLGDLLRLELSRDAPGEVAQLHRIAAGWYADNGYEIEAIRHAELGEDWELATELLGRHWVHLLLDGEEATLGSLLAGLPAGLETADAELATIAAAGRLAESRWMEADELLAAAERAVPAVPAPRRSRAQTALATVQLLRARRLGDLDGVVEGAGAMLHAGGTADAELEALALMNLGIVETWTRRFPEAQPHLEEALALGRRVGRPYIEIGSLGALGVVPNVAGQPEAAEELLRQAIAVAQRVGWSTHPIVATAYVTLGAVLLGRGRLADAEGWLERADPILSHAPEPAASVGLRHAQGMLEMARGRFADAHAAFSDGERLIEQLRATHFLAAVERPWRLRAELRLGELEAVREAIGAAPDDAAAGAAWRNLEAHLCLASGDAQGAAAAVAPVLAGEAFAPHVNLEIEALLLDALSRTEMGERPAAERSVERALELGEPHGHVWIVLTVPNVRDVLQRHPLHNTAHAAYLKTLLDQLAGIEPATDAADELPEPLSERELAVMRFLPTNLSASEIGNELFVSVHTVKTHMRKLYAKLDVHTRADAVQRGRALGLLAPARRG
jgi:LuxR family transcriptional regulator, maltose regulon positive regulatory protein